MASSTPRLPHQPGTNPTQRDEGGELCKGAALPSEATLTARFGVSRWTVRQALTELETAGLIETRQGRGRFVK
ncbi:GntR family transcriptional regulator [Actinacidiphila epipremni]|uniref:GntR family transcriptional regulator n=1 Tax=Actinacidiphila epipremni TaxID=2053013 RepID=A0ABX0ZDM2_9ACTN|nr:GntR family transcriptional regulator [Actinacidiphila epipremni]NJP41854.1 GntR family transcriptional regulator [Actinacidiphila epipremni]